MEAKAVMKKCDSRVIKILSNLDKNGNNKSFLKFYAKYNGFYCAIVG